MSEPSEESPGNRYLPRVKWRETTFYETYKSQISILVEGLKLLGLANGGAAVALITMAGSAVIKCTNSPSITSAVELFAYGLAAVIVAFFTSYLSQMGFLKYLDTEKESWKYFHITFFIVATFAVIASVALFVLGAVDASTTFTSFKCAEVASAKGT
ncbi:MAG: hypothetical protein ACYCZH_06195 [Sulfuriferula sp.]